MQAELDATIQEGVANIVQLLKNTEAGGASASSAAAREDDEDRYTASRRQQAYLQNNGEEGPRRPTKPCVRVWSLSPKTGLQTAS